VEWESEVIGKRQVRPPFFFLLFLSTNGSLSTAALATWAIVLVLYVSSIVGSRLYTGMLGLLDVFVGIILGITGLVLQLVVMPEVERWVTNSGWSGTSFMSGKLSNPYAHSSSQLL